MSWLGGITSPMPTPLPSYVCAHDPLHPEGVGAVTSEPAYRRKSRGCLFLPIDPGLERDLRLGGFVRRSWGPDGWLFNLNRGEEGSPVALQVKAGVPFIHWAAGLAPRGGTASGSLRLKVDQASVAMLNSGLAIVSTPDPFEVSVKQPCFVVRGVARYTGQIDGFLGLGLWGVCRNVGVLWVAVSQSSHA